MTETEEKTGNGTKLTLCFMRLNARLTQKYCEILFCFFLRQMARSENQSKHENRLEFFFLISSYCITTL